MKILIYGPDFPFLLNDNIQPSISNENIKPIGGTIVETLAWAYGFRKNGHKVGILTFEGAYKYSESTYNYDLIEPFKIRENKSVGLKKKDFVRTIIAISKYKPDLIMLEGTIDLVYFFSFISRMLNIKFIYRFASDKDCDKRVKNDLSGFMLLLYNLGLRALKYISTQNLYQFGKLEKKFPGKNIFLHYNPVLINYDLRILDKKERSYIAWVGNFRKEKNLKSLYNAAVKCKEVKFKIAGVNMPGVDEETRKYIALIEQLPNISFEGYIKRSEINNFLSKAYALLNTSHLEGFSNTFLEAWAVGTPVISTVFVNPDNIIIEKSIGIIAKDFDEIPLCIEELLNKSDEEYSMLTERCRRYLIENHDPEKAAKQFIDQISK